MTVQFIRVGDYLINPAHIVAVDFTPAYAGGEVNEEEAKGVLTDPRPARIEIITTEIRPYQYTDYDGNPTGTCGVSRTTFFTGELAEAVWDYLSREASVNVEEFRLDRPGVAA
jgi:hypothetical protein